MFHFPIRNVFWIVVGLSAVCGFGCVLAATLTGSLFTSLGVGGGFMLIVALFGGALREFSWGKMKFKTHESPYRYWLDEKSKKG